MAGTASTSSGLLAWRFPEDADRRGAFFAAAKNPDKWFGAGTGDVGDEPTEEASVRVSREPCDDERERVVELSESSAECVEELEACLRVAMSGAL
jgi:hypothetical protein